MRLTNNFGIGVDIESIKRFREFKKNDKMLGKIFTSNELNYCFSKKAPARYLAVRFTAKEAIIKAISSLGKKTLPLNKIEIIRNINGVPMVNLKGCNIKVSLSHCKDKAIAFAIVEKN